MLLLTIWERPLVSVAMFDAEIVDGVGQLGAADGDAFVQVDAVQAPLPNILDLESRKREYFGIKKKEILWNLHCTENKKLLFYFLKNKTDSNKPN